MFSLERELRSVFHNVTTEAATNDNYNIVGFHTGCIKRDSNWNWSSYPGALHVAFVQVNVSGLLLLSNLQSDVSWCIGDRLQRSKHF
jgi:hypothetical protein